MTKRKKYSKEFKLDAIALVQDQNYNIAEAARNLGVSAQMLARWIKEAESDEGQAFRGNGKLTPEQDEIRKLKAQVKRLEMEREILKNGLPSILAPIKIETRVVLYSYLNLESSRSLFGDFISR
jgi:transposase